MPSPVEERPGALLADVPHDRHFRRRPHTRRRRWITFTVSDQTIPPHPHISGFEIRYPAAADFIGRPLPLASASRCPLSPLFEEERHPGGGALVADRPRPGGMHRPRARPAFAADDHPMDAREIEAAERPEQGFEREEPYRGCGVADVLDARAS